MEKCDVLEKYIEKRLEIYLPGAECSIELQVNGGLNLALAAALNVFSRLQRSIKVSYLDRSTDLFTGQYLEYQPVFEVIKIPQSAITGILKQRVTVQLQWMQVTPVLMMVLTVLLMMTDLKGSDLFVL